jgi:hypothetical protein
MGKNKLSKVAHGAGQAGDSAKLTESLTTVVEQFRTDAHREVERGEWEDSVRARSAFVKSKANQEMAERALGRAKQAVPLATDIYDGLYEPLGFAEPAIAEIAQASCEAQLLALCAVIPPGDWPALLVAATKSAALLAFTVGHQASLAGVADTAKVIRVWHANATAITSVAQCQTILGLNLVNGDVLKAVKAARILGTVPVPDVATLAALDAGGHLASIAEMESLAKLGGDLVANKSMRALPTPPKDTEITAFNTKAGTTAAEVAECWDLLTANVDDDLKKCQIIKSLAMAPEAKRTHFKTLVENYDDLMDRTSISGSTVASLLDAGLLKARGKKYSSGNWGPGAVYVFELTGQGRLHPEWHIHFKSAGGKKEALVAGAGWKDADEKYGAGVKTFGGSEPKLVASLKAAGAWKSTSF